MSGQLLGRTALVTGAGNGLGRAIALQFAARGARVILAGRQRGKLEAVAAEAGGPVREAGGSVREAGGSVREAGGSVREAGGSMREARGPVRVATVDTAAPESVAALAATLADEDISILVNNAGIAGPVAPLWEVEPAEWDEVFAINVRGVYLMCRAFLPAMISAGRGDIINVASVSGKRPLARRTPYTASKTAVIGLTTTLAHEVGPLGINVNTLSPGPVTGPRMARNFALEAARTGSTPEAAEAEFVSRSALRRMVTEEEVALAAVAILGMPGLTGADIDLSAGMIGR